MFYGDRSYFEHSHHHSSVFIKTFFYEICWFSFKLKNYLGAVHKPRDHLYGVLDPLLLVVFGLDKKRVFDQTPTLTLNMTK